MDHKKTTFEITHTKCYNNPVLQDYNRGVVLIILGIDPGTARCGLGIIEKTGNKLTTVSYGLIESDKDRPHPERLEVIFSEVTRSIKRHKPDLVAVEKLFFSKNVKTAMSVGEARGVILLAAQLAGVEIREFSPMDVKLALTGYGLADKNQVMQMTRAILCLKEIPKPDDVADALAIAVCCASSSKMDGIVKNAGKRENWKSLGDKRLEPKVRQSIRDKSKEHKVEL